MLREAELFVMADDVLVEVVGRIRGPYWDTVIPAIVDVPGDDKPASMRELVSRYARDDASLPDVLAGRSPEGRAEIDLLGDDAHEQVVVAASAARAAAAAVTDGDELVNSVDGSVPTRTHLLQATVWRTFTAHEIAMALGSRACPLTEDLARGLLDATGPDAEKWRSLGVFREPMPFPDGHVSWRDQFLLTAGRDPHPFLND